MMESKPKILLADDKIENIIALEKLLSPFNIETVRALSGNEALAKTCEHEFALALIDVQMPEMDGYETVRLLRQVNVTRYLPVIFISAIFSDNQYLIEGIEAGAVDFITKPIVPRILLGKVKIFIELYEQKCHLQWEIKTRKQSECNLLIAEKKLREAKLKAENADKMKSAFLANMSHELRTPMNSIIGFASLLKADDLDFEKKLKYISYINNAGESLLSLINDVIDFAKIEADQLKINIEKIKVKEVIIELFDIYKEELIRKDKAHISLKLDLPLADADVVIETDPYRLRQILSNLLMNALKYTLNGDISLGYHFDIPESITFFVQDTGIGIPADKVAFIFDRFMQVEDTPNDTIVGTGLGLAISKKLTDLLQGRIWVESMPGVGSTFYFSIPLCHQETVPDETKKLQNTPVQVSQNSFAFLQKKILIAEDEEINFFFLKEALRNSQVTILWGKNGKEAVELYEQNTDVSLILMDIKMPVMDGYQALHKIKKMSSVPIIAQTAYAMAGEKEMILKAGFDEYLTKPINIELLRSLLIKYMQ